MANLLIQEVGQDLIDKKYRPMQFAIQNVFKTINCLQF